MRGYLARKGLVTEGRLPSLPSGMLPTGRLPRRVCCRMPGSMPGIRQEVLLKSGAYARACRAVSVDHRDGAWPSPSQGAREEAAVDAPRPWPLAKTQASPATAVLSRRSRRRWPPPASRRTRSSDPWLRMEAPKAGSPLWGKLQDGEFAASLNHRARSGVKHPDAHGHLALTGLVPRLKSGTVDEASDFSRGWI